MTVIRRIVVGYAAILVLIIAMVVVGVLVLAPLRSGIKDYGDTVLGQVKAASQVAVTSSAMGTDAIVGVVAASEESRAEALGQLAADKAAALEALAAVAAMKGVDTEDLAAVQNLQSLVEQYDSRIQAANAVAGTDKELALTRLTREVGPLGEQLAAAASAYYETEHAKAIAEADRLVANVNVMWLVLLIMTGVVVIAGLFASITIPRNVSRHLRAAIAGIDSSANEMLAIASQVAASAAQTAAATNETTATVEEVKQTALLANEKASQVADSSQNVAHYAETGRTSVEETVTAFERIQAQMGVVAEAINRLSDQTQAVGEIITTVNDLAEQSNLLSVNASIEAAKAGDQGKGFTVVAQEVKSLAEQSKQAVAQVRTILSEIQKASNMAVQAAEQGHKAIAAGRQQIEQTGEGTLSLADAANEAAQSAVQISASSRQQLAGMEQISQAIGSINQAGSQSVMGTRQVEQEVRQLQELALRLKRLVDSKAKA